MVLGLALGECGVMVTQDPSKVLMPVRFWSLALDKQHEIRYNRHMAKIEEGRVGHCNRCEQGEHGIESKYRAGHCACCGTEVEYA